MFWLYGRSNRCTGKRVRRSALYGSIYAHALTKTLYDAVFPFSLEAGSQNPYKCMVMGISGGGPRGCTPGHKWVMKVHARRF